MAFGRCPVSHPFAPWCPRLSRSRFARRALSFQCMTLNQFNALPEDRQLAAVYAAGTYVARRWQEV